MITLDGLTGELSDLGQAIGVVDGSGGLETEWLANPLPRLESILSDENQRAALLRLVNALLPAATIPGLPDGERWHPLLGTQPRGNVYLTVRETADGVIVGAAADLGSLPSAETQARIRAQIPLVRAGAGVNAIAGTPDGPLGIDLRIDVNWTRNTAAVPPQPIGLRAVVAHAKFDPAPTLRVVLEGLQLDDRPAVDRVLDVAQLGRDAPELIAGLLRQVLANSAPSPSVTLLADHLLGLFGLGDSEVPPFPFAQLADGPAALQRWLDSMLVPESPTAPVLAWLTHLAALVGTTATPSGAGTLDDPWRITLVQLAANAELALTVSRRNGTARFGVLVDMPQDLGGGTIASLQGAIAIVDLPLAGTTAARALPDGVVRVHLAGAAGAPLVENPGTFKVGALDAGVAWNGTSLDPLLALTDVQFGGARYPKLDLTNIDSVVDAAANGVLATIVAALGPGVGRHLAAIAGLTGASDPADRDQPLASWPHHIAATKLVTDPAAAIAAYHRTVLLSGSHSWNFLLGDVAALLGITEPVTGTGTRIDPWRVPLAAVASGIAIEVVAWNDASGAPATDPQKLRLGLRLAAGSPPLQFEWLAELLAFDLPASGSGSVSFVGAQHAGLQFAPAFDGTLFGDVTASVDSVIAEASWRPGSPFTWDVRAENLRIVAPEGDVSVPSLRLPPAGGFDIGSLGATAASLGIGVQQLEMLLRLLLARLAGATGDEGRVVAALLGLHRQLPGLATDAPTIDDPAQPGRTLSDPVAALRGMLRRATESVRADGNAHLTQLLAWADTTLADTLPSLDAEEGESIETPAPIGGCGTYDDPWELPWPGSDSGSTRLQLWLEPDGPPSSWAAGVATRASASTDLIELAAVLRLASAFRAPLSATLRGRETDTIASALLALDTHLLSGDGVVPLESQSPNIFGWEHGEPLAAPHHLLTRDASAIAQILARVDSLAGSAASPRVVLLLGPSFLDEKSWSDLLASPLRNGTTDAGAHFELRTPGVDPLTISLDSVTAVADYYTANLADDGGGDLSRLVSQIDRIANRLEALHSGVAITLVAHSTAGIAARAYTAANRARVKGLITLGTPHIGAPLPFLIDPLTGDGVRVAQSARTGAPSNTPLRQALDHLVAAIDGYVAETPNAPARRQPYPFASFNAIAPFDTGDVPVLALGSGLAETLLDVLKTDVGAFATAESTSGHTPTHLAGGISLPMDVGTSAEGEVTVDAIFREGLFQIALDPAAPPAVRPVHAMRAEARMHRGEDWLLGGPSTFPRTGDITDPRQAFVDARARSITLGLDIAPAAAGGKATAVPFFTVTHGAFRSPTREQLDASDPLGHAVIGEALDTLARSVTGASSAQLLLDALRAIGLVVDDAHGAAGLSSDAWTALTSDPLGTLGAAIPGALARPDGWLGLHGDAQGPWTWSPPGSPIELVVTQTLHAPWRVALRASAASQATVAGAALVRLGIDLESELPSFVTTGGIELGLGPVLLRFDTAARTLDASAPPWLDKVRLLPAPSSAELGAALNAAFPRVLFSGALSAALSALVPGARAAAIERFLRSTGEYLHGADVFGRADGAGFDGARVAQLLRTINDVAGLPEGDALQLPGDLSVIASGAGTDADPLTLLLSTAAPIGGLLSIAAGVRIDSLRHASPHGTVTIDTPLGGTWPRVAVRFGVDASGVTLSVLPEGLPEIRILPSFSGLGSLRGVAAALLPQVLDSLVTELGTPAPTWLARLLDVAKALQLYDDAGKFVGHTAQLQALLSPNWRDTFDASLRSGVASAAAALANAMSLPGTIAASNGLFTWSINLGAPDQRVGVALGWSGSDPQLGVFAEHVALGAGAMSVNASLGVGPAGLDCSGSLAASLTAVGLSATPTLAFALTSTTSTSFRVRVLPLADASGDGPLEIVLAPELALNAGAETGTRVLSDWALPLVVNAVIETERAQLGRKLWESGPSVQDALTFAQLLDTTGKIVLPLPSLGRIATGLLSGLGTLPPVSLGTLDVGVVTADARVGLRLSGHQDVGRLSIRFGAPVSWTTPSGIDAGTPGADGGLELFLLRTGGEDIDIDVGLLVAGVGIGIAGADGTKLVDTSLVRIGELRAYLFMAVETAPSLHVDHFGAGAELIGFGLPLGAATSGNVGGTNPVAANLLRSDSGDAGGDSRPVNPDVDVDVWYWQPPADTSGSSPFHVRFGGEGGGATLWVPVHSGFGPLYIDQVGVTADSTSASLLVDGGVKVAGLNAQVDDLTVRVPYDQVSDPTHWSLDLKGLALGFTAPGIAISGALVKFDGPPIEYDGMLLIKLTQIGAIAVGSYAVVGSGAAEFTSLAIFGGVFVPVGIPPIINITALGIGLGYNRRLVVPQDLNEIPSFFLIQALDRPEEIANDPMKALFSFRNAVPPARGSLWLAAGLRGTTFEVINVTAVVYVALDRGMEVGLLGVARMAVPNDDTTLARVEVALKARFSAAEGLFSVQAQLTDNSWLISPDCQLTGGWALLYWFRESQVLFTMGGYHPAFQRRPEFPEVPRLGYHWNFAGLVQMKGESYFAITNSAVMAGLRIEATYGASWLQLWFNGHADFLIVRHPFHYQASVGIEVGARVRIKVCFFKCVRITVSVSVGADLELEGPPLHGIAKIDLGVASIDIPFGDDAPPALPLMPWEPFKLKYLKADDTSTVPVSAQVVAGLMPSEPPGAKVAAGSQAEPWRIASEWTFRTETRMPARGFVFQVDVAHSEGEMNAVVFGRYTPLSSVYAFDLAPMGIGSHDIESLHRFVLYRKPEGGGNFAPLVPRSVTPLPADRTFIIDERMFRVRPIIGKVPEATYHYFSDLKPPAAANTLPVLLGLEIEGVAFMIHPSAVIPIAKLRDATNPRPLPFAKTPPIFAEWQISGADAEIFATIAQGRSPRVLVNAFAQVLSGNGGFSARRVQAKLPAEGLPAVATRALKTRRSSPPMLSTLSLGLAMRPAAQPLPPVVNESAARPPVALDTIRLRAVMQQRVAPTSVTAPTVRMTIDRVARALRSRGEVRHVDVGRDLLRQVSVPGAKLLTHARPDAARATHMPASVVSLRSAEIGATLGRGISRRFSELEKAAQGNSVQLRAGVTQLWEVPPKAAKRLVIWSGNGDARNNAMAVRVTLLGAGGTLLSDAEYSGRQDVELELPDACTMVAVTGLGGNRSTFSSNGNGATSARPGAVTSRYAPPGATPNVGWELRQQVAQLSPTLLLARGATILLSQQSAARSGKQSLGVGSTVLGDALRGQTAVETRLPAGTSVVGVLLDLERSRALSPEDLVVGIANARFVSDPIRVEGGNRALLLYDVAPDAVRRDAPSLAITVAVRSGARLAGVVGLGGSARVWGERMNGRIPEQLVPDEPLTADGEAQLRFVLS